MAFSPNDPSLSPGKWLNKRFFPWKAGYFPHPFIARLPLRKNILYIVDTPHLFTPSRLICLIIGGNTSQCIWDGIHYTHDERYINIYLLLKTTCPISKKIWCVYLFEFWRGKGEYCEIITSSSPRFIYHCMYLMSTLEQQLYMYMYF